MLFINTVLILGILCVASSHPSTLDQRLTRSKLNQYSSTDCSNPNNNGVSTNVNMNPGTCIDIDGKTHSIFLAKGTGPVWARNMVAYAQTGCPPNMRIERFQEHDSGSACMNVDFQMLGQPGTTGAGNRGRMMSVKFTST